MTRQVILSTVILILLVITIGLQIHEMVAAYQPFTQYCDEVQPGVLRCHR